MDDFAPVRRLLFYGTWNKREGYHQGFPRGYGLVTIMPTPKAGGTYSVMVEVMEKFGVENVLIGEVWYGIWTKQYAMTPKNGLENVEEEIKKRQLSRDYYAFSKLPQQISDNLRNQLKGKMGGWLHPKPWRG